MRDCPHGLQRLIEALAAQTLDRERFEVIVADDGSKDQSAERLAADRDWVRVTRGAPDNSYAARNRAAKLARGSVLAFTDADCTPHVNWLAAGLAALQSADLVGGQIDLVLPARPTTWTIVDATLFDQERFVAMGKAATANLFVTRALFEQQSGFDPTLPSGGDWDFVERSAQAGARMAFSSDARIQHPTRDTASAFLARRWRIEHTFARRFTRAGLSLLAFNRSREPVVARRWGYAVGYDDRRVGTLGLPDGWRSRLKTIPVRYLIIPAVEVLALTTGVLRTHISVTRAKRT